MMFRYIKVRKKIVHGAVASEILGRLDEYISRNETQPMRLLVNHWKDQQDAMSYKEIRSAILSEDVPAQFVKDWTGDYSRFVINRLVPMWEDAAKAGAKGQPAFDNVLASFRFNSYDPGIRHWIDDRSASFVVDVTQQQVEAMRALIRQHMYENYNVDELAKIIRPCVGLTENQSRTVLKYYENLKANMRAEHPRMKESNLEAKCREKAMRYAERMHRDRARLIAQTEMVFAYNHGMHESMRQAMQQGLIGILEKRWATSTNENVCPVCEALNGTQIGFDADFDFGKHRHLFDGQEECPPAHPRCACVVEYIEVAPPVFDAQSYDAVPDEDEDVFDTALRFDDPKDAEEYFGRKPDISLRRTDREEYDRQRERYRQSMYAKWEDTLTTDEGLAVAKYTTDDFRMINGILRHEVTEVQVRNWDSFQQGMTSPEAIGHIESAISKFELRDSIIVYRTCEEDVFENLSKEVGSMFHDDAFFSASLDKAPKASGNVFMEIAIPKGVGQGAYIQPWSGTDEEYEFLVDRGGVFKVLGYEERDGSHYFQMQLVGFDKKDWSYATREEVKEIWDRRKIPYDQDTLLKI